MVRWVKDGPVLSVRDDTIRTLTMKDKEDDDDAACESTSCLGGFQPPFLLP